MGKIANGVEFLNDHLKDEVTDMDNPDCNMCNECCSLGTMLLPDEYKELKKYLSKDKRGKILYKEGVAKIEKHMKKGIIYFMCPFSTKNKRCAIYNIRPSICRKFHCKKELNTECKDDYKNKEHFTIHNLFSHAFKK